METLRDLLQTQSDLDLTWVVLGPRHQVCFLPAQTPQFLADNSFSSDLRRLQPQRAEVVFTHLTVDDELQMESTPDGPSKSETLRRHS